MTDDRVPTPPSDQHLDDEVLGALLDGECAPDEAAAADEHLLGCPSCSARREELAGTLGLAAAPVAPMPAAVREAQIRRALLAAPPSAEPDGASAAGSPAPRPLRAQDERPRWQGIRLRVAAVIVLVGALSAAVYGASRLARNAGVGGAGIATTIPPEAAIGPRPVGWLRPVAGRPPRSCPSLDRPSSPTAVDALPNAILPASHSRPGSVCLLVGPVAVSLEPYVTVRLSGPAGLVAPDTLTFEVAPGDVPSRLLGTPPPGRELVLQADGAAVGVVRSVTRRGAFVEVVVDDIPPAVAEYLKGVFAGQFGH